MNLLLKNHLQKLLGSGSGNHSVIPRLLSVTITLRNGYSKYLRESSFMEQLLRALRSIIFIRFPENENLRFLLVKILINTDFHDRELLRPPCMSAWVKKEISSRRRFLLIQLYWDVKFVWVVVWLMWFSVEPWFWLLQSLIRLWFWLLQNFSWLMFQSLCGTWFWWIQSLTELWFFPRRGSWMHMCILQGLMN